jgi:hypothetical protein
MTGWRGTSLVTAIVALLLLFALGVTLVEHQRDHQAAEPVPGPVLPDNEPFPGAQLTSMSGAESSAKFEVPTPNDSLAADSSAKQAWTADSANQIAIDYNSGVRIEYSQEPAPGDPLTHFQSLAIEYPGATVQTVAGVPALVLPENNPGNGCGADSTICVPAQNNLASVTFWIGGLRVEIYGHFPADELVRVGNSMKTASP